MSPMWVWSIVMLLCLSPSVTCANLKKISQLASRFRTDISKNFIWIFSTKIHSPHVKTLVFTLKRYYCKLGHWVPLLKALWLCRAPRPWIVSMAILERLINIHDFQPVAYKIILVYWAIIKSCLRQTLLQNICTSEIVRCLVKSAEDIT